MSKSSDESISLILPIYNRQETIVARVENLLEDLSDLSDRIQLILVDDCSQDATPELLDDLRRRFPQISVLRQPSTLGPATAVQRGLRYAIGDLVFVQESYENVELDEISQLWKLRIDPELVMARARTRKRKIDASLLEKLSDWGKRLEENLLGRSCQTSELQMYRREIVDSLVSMTTAEGSLEIAHLSHRRIASPKLVQHEPVGAKSLARNSR